MESKNIIIKGNYQSLIEFEPILSMLGLKSNEYWNKGYFLLFTEKNDYLFNPNIKIYNFESYSYRPEIMINGIKSKTKIFKVTEIEKIINYVESFKTKNNEKINE